MASKWVAVDAVACCERDHRLLQPQSIASIASKGHAPDLELGVTAISNAVLDCVSFSVRLGALIWELVRFGVDDRQGWRCHWAGVSPSDAVDEALFLSLSAQPCKCECKQAGLFATEILALYPYLQAGFL